MRRAVPRRARPRVSVVIASYRWAEALELSLESALSQTVGDLEVLVIEDGDDLASQTVVESTGDRRARWLSLKRGSGSQSGPNELGRRIASAPVVAYLGHDDIWHETHLARLLESLGPGIDIAHAVTCYLEEPTVALAHESEAVALAPPELGGGTLRLAGLTRWDPTAFVPPSSVAHRRRGRRIGRWPDPSSTGWPIDYAFLLDCCRRGARFAASGAPTVFKYAASLRPDVYRTRDVRPQLRVRAALRRDPNLGIRLLNHARASGLSGDDGRPGFGAPGASADHNRRMRGLPPRYRGRNSVWDAADSVVWRGFHPVEHDELGAFAWTDGRSRTAIRLDPPARDGPLGVRIEVRHVVVPEQLKLLKVDLAGEPLTCLEEPSGRAGFTSLVGWLEHPASGEVVEVGLRTLPVIPAERIAGSPDQRVLGVALARIELLSRRPA